VMFEPLLRRRLNFFALMNSEEMHKKEYVTFRYMKQLKEYKRAEEESSQLYDLLQQVHARLRLLPEDDKHRAEEETFYHDITNEYKFHYSVWKVTAERRQQLEDAIWQEYHITKEGRVPIVRRKNGCRNPIQENVLHHLVSAKHCVKDIQQAVGNEAQIETYNEDQIAQAIDACWEGDEVVLFPGTYELSDFLFHESITIRGATNNPEDVVILADDSEDNFLVIDSDSIAFKNVTLEARRNTEGCIVLNGGHCLIENCVLNCDKVTRGVIVNPFAICEMSNTSVKGEHENSVVIHPAGKFIDGGENVFSQPPALKLIQHPLLVKKSDIQSEVDRVSVSVQTKTQNTAEPAVGGGDNLVA